MELDAVCHWPKDDDFDGNFLAFSQFYNSHMSRPGGKIVPNQPGSRTLPHYHDYICTLWFLRYNRKFPISGRRKQRCFSENYLGLTMRSRGISRQLLLLECRLWVPHYRENLQREFIIIVCMSL